MRRTKEQISFNMSRIRNRGTRIEKILSSALRKAKIRFKQQIPLVGKPDFVVGDKKVAVFCDSAFWHGYKGMRTSRHDFKRNSKFWTNKIFRNIQRDKEVNGELKRRGWKVIRFWDFQIIGDTERCIKKIKKILHPKRLSR